MEVNEQRRLLVSDYEAPKAVRSFHNSPRFGHSSDASLLLGSNKVDYIQGTLFIAVFCLILLLLWIIAVLVFKCMDPNKSGIIGGHPFQKVRREIEPSDYSKRIKAKHIAFRVLMLCSSLGILISGILLLRNGRGSLDGSYDDIQGAASELIGLADQVLQASHELQEFGESISNLNEALLTELSQQICEADGSGGFQDQFNATVVQMRDAVKSVDVVYAINSFTSIVNTVFATALLKFIMSTMDFSSFGGALISMKTMLSNKSSGLLKRRLDSTQISAMAAFVALPTMFFGIAVLFGTLFIYLAVPIIIVAIMMFIGTIIAILGLKSRHYAIFQSDIVMPFFFMTLVICAIAVAFTGTLLVVNSDVCMGGTSQTPEGFVKAVMDQSEFMENRDISETVKYFVLEKCTGDFPLQSSIDYFLSHLSTTLNDLYTIESEIVMNKDAIELMCKPQDLNSLSLILGHTFQAFQNFFGLVDQVFESIDCQKFNAIFEDLYYNSLCTSTPTTLVWIFATLITIYILGILMFFARGAMLPSEKEKIVNNAFETLIERDEESADTAPSQPKFSRRETADTANSDECDEDESGRRTPKIRNSDSPLMGDSSKSKEDLHRFFQANHESASEEQRLLCEVYNKNGLYNLNSSTSHHSEEMIVDDDLDDQHSDDKEENYDETASQEAETNAEESEDDDISDDGLEDSIISNNEGIEDIADDEDDSYISSTSHDKNSQQEDEQTHYENRRDSLKDLIPLRLSVIPEAEAKYA
ncbi:hypothetical protein CTEN210_18254 [Chaetoceros tenuissimus]|uniref:Uncharacterized protein n=1 Tax=Chaetoceros tenuissimus TaxID=426638 RepID=A0AAD3DCC6_9STRA|nr:hypothetical protein CTEN210_18254 [Chaetoceros tenuissimus]